jgi:hypothetical protein
MTRYSSVTLVVVHGEAELLGVEGLGTVEV